MLPQLLAYLFEIIKPQYQIIIYLMGALLGKSPTNVDAEEPAYQKLQIDELPVIETLPRLDYHQLLAEYEHR